MNIFCLPIRKEGGNVTYENTLQIGFIGAGRAGCSLGKYFVTKGAKVMGYYSRTKESAEWAASFTDTVHYASIKSLVNECNTIFITVSDSEIANVWSELSCHDISGKIICHTSGALSSSVFLNQEALGAFGYSLHPLYAINSKENSYKEFDKVYFTIEGRKEHLRDLMDFISSFGNRITAISSQDKVRYHAAAVFASNLVCGLYEKACNILCDCGFEKNDADAALSSLFLGNSTSIANLGVKTALTGPCERGDIATVTKHLDALCGDDETIYRLLSKELINIATIKNPDKDYAALNDILSLNDKEDLS